MLKSKIKQIIKSGLLDSVFLQDLFCTSVTHVISSSEAWRGGVVFRMDGLAGGRLIEIPAGSQRQSDSTMPQRIFAYCHSRFGVVRRVFVSFAVGAFPGDHFAIRINARLYVYLFDSFSMLWMSGFASIWWRTVPDGEWQCPFY